MKTKKSAFALLAAIALLAACGKKDSEAPPAVKASPGAATSSMTVPSLERRAPGSRSYSPIDMAWDSLPSAEFVKTRGQIRNLYWSGAEKNLEKLAEDFSDAYRREADSFKKADLLKSLTPELNQRYAEAQKTKDYAVRTANAEAGGRVAPYDPQIGGFKVSFDANSERRGVGLKKDDDPAAGNKRWFIRFVGVPTRTPLIYKAVSEAEAREIEAALAAQRVGGAPEVLVDAAFLGSVAGAMYAAGDLADTALFAVDAIGIVDKKSGKTLFTLGRAGELGPIQPSCHTTREALKLPEPISTDKSSMGGMYSSSPAFC